MPDTITDTIRTELTWTRHAWDLYTSWKERCNRIRAWYGEPAANHARVSLARCIDQLLACGPAQVMTEGDMLYVSTPHIVFGIVWHPDSDPVQLELGGRVTADRGDMPAIGTWSCHS